MQRCELREVFGHRIPVAGLTDLILGKIWAWEDPRRLLSNRIKDETDLIRIAETYPGCRPWLPLTLRDKLIAEEQKGDDPNRGISTWSRRPARHTKLADSVLLQFAKNLAIREDFFQPQMDASERELNPYIRVN